MLYILFEIFSWWTVVGMVLSVGVSKSYPDGIQKISTRRALTLIAGPMIIFWSVAMAIVRRTIKDEAWFMKYYWLWSLEPNFDALAEDEQSEQRPKTMVLHYYDPEIDKFVRVQRSRDIDNSVADTVVDWALEHRVFNKADLVADSAAEQRCLQLVSSILEEKLQMRLEDNPDGS